MAEDWVQQYLSNGIADQREKAALRRADLASAGAMAYFKSLADRVEQDLATYRQQTRRAVEYTFVPLCAFMVSHSPDPFVSLQVKLTETRIAYHRQLQRDDTGSPQTASGHFLIKGEPRRERVG